MSRANSIVGEYVFYYFKLRILLINVFCQVPKLLLHRLFPNVRYSIWIDGKLKLVRDPYQVLER